MRRRLACMDYCWTWCFFFSSRRRHTRCSRDWSSDVCSSDLGWPSPLHPRPLLEPGRQNPLALPIPFGPAPLAPPDRSLSPFPPCPSSARQTPSTDPGGHQPTPARLAGAAPSARFQKVMDLLAFAYDRSFILEALRSGEIDYLEHVGEALEGDFFRQLIGREILNRLANSYPTPREKEEVPTWLNLASEISLKLHGSPSHQIGR